MMIKAIYKFKNLQELTLLSRGNESIPNYLNFPNLKKVTLYRLNCNEMEYKETYEPDMFPNSN